MSAVNRDDLSYLPMAPPGSLVYYDDLSNDVDGLERWGAYVCLAHGPIHGRRDAVDARQILKYADVILSSGGTVSDVLMCAPWWHEVTRDG